MLFCPSRSVGGWLKDSLKGSIRNKQWTFAQGKGYLFGRKLFQCALCFDSIGGGVVRNSDYEHLRRLAFGIFSLSNLNNLWDALAAIGRPGYRKSPKNKPVYKHSHNWTIDITTIHYWKCRLLLWSLKRKKRSLQITKLKSKVRIINCSSIWMAG